MAWPGLDNLNNKKTTLTNNTGNFTLPAKIGDLLVLKAFAYQVDTLVLTKMNEQEVFMEPVTNELNQGNIITTETINLLRPKASRTTADLRIR
ncbi:hypothetical protein NAF17_09585 [Mucilaginibacter sp. RB4R14]|uniref:hypothetical protein n=1 Tax=Mucilaginibacter aurantiaciroseus TaxID=2949308 RepID=UPI002091610B|nr:hypothetical protein [Mucilaginibacter aurantiaciroseus]MCO5935794.1 hypothetical protein [Mucilaginibacter aurantiaciroseus]